MRSKKPMHAAAICDDGLALDDPAAAAVAATLPLNNEWQTQQQTRRLERALRRSTIDTASPSSSRLQGPRRFDPPTQLFNSFEPQVSPSLAPITPQVAAGARAGLRRSQGGQVIAWLIVVAGTLVLAGGIGLVAWSLAAGQMLYWNLAMGLTLSGQGTLIFGLVLVVSRLWRNSRYATGRLQDVHAGLNQLQQTADVFAAMRSGGAPNFYADLLRGASPQVLLANLKGQVDQLAARVGAW
ncbi:MAG TPA: hypothetical protein VHK01_17075 [Lacipirellulaceae bacterium]|jgi:hypothetical protein|nr:hypothetical protein [Lacipirellulaceae bacterium]